MQGKNNKTVKKTNAGMYTAYCEFIA